MVKLDLESFEKKIVVRNLALEDIPAILNLAERCFPGMKPWKAEQLESQISIFREGQFCIEFEGKIVGSASSLMVDFDDYDSWHDWREISGDGYIRNHDAEGDTLYGIEIMVDPYYRGNKLARRLYDARKNYARQNNLRRIMIAGRIPGYGQHADQLTARQYVEKVMSRDIFDPVLTVQLSNGFVLERLIPDYLPGDKESRGFATFLEWPNLEWREAGRRRFRAVQTVRICVVQYGMRPISSFDDFAKQCEFFIDTASDYHADFLLFPELFTTQLLSLVRTRRPGQAARKLAEYTSKYLELFTKLAIKHSINIVGGSQFMFENEKLYNVACLFRRDGTIEKQYKLHITPSERKWWGVVPGDRVEVFDTDCGKISIQICYDIEFPELSRVAAAKGARIIFVPFNTNERYGYLRVRNCALARAVENEVYVATSGCTGNLPFVENADMHYAQSGIYTPSDFPFSRDAIAAESAANTETLVVQDVDLEALRRQRLSGTVTTWNDRRKDLYRLIYIDPDKGEIEI